MAINVKDFGIKISDLIEEEPDLLLDNVPILRMTCYIGKDRKRLMSNKEIVQAILSTILAQLSYDIQNKVWFYKHENGHKYMIIRAYVCDFVKKIISANCEGYKYDEKSRTKMIMELLEQAMAQH